MAWDESGTKREVASLARRYPAPRQSRIKGEDGGIYTAEMGPPPQDVDGGILKPKKAKKFAGGGKIDGCAQRGKTRGKVV